MSARKSQYRPLRVAPSELLGVTKVTLADLVWDLATAHAGEGSSVFARMDLIRRHAEAVEATRKDKRALLAFASCKAGAP